MKTTTTQTHRTLHSLLLGKSRRAKRYAGKHVLIVRDEVTLLRETEKEIWAEIERLRKKYGETPVITFVPCHDVSYIL